MRYKLDALKAAIDADRSRLCIALRLQADGKRFLCPFCQNEGAKHTTGDLSIEQGFKCFKCGWSGNGFNLVQSVKKCEFKEALDYIANVYHITPETTERSYQASPKNEKGKTIHPTIEKAISAILWGINKDGKAYTITRQDAYTDKDGLPVAYVLRFDCPEGKEYRPVHAVSGGWSGGDPKGLWPMFNFPSVLASDTVFICEGEKASEAGNKIGLTCTTSAHGAKSPQKTDWSWVKGKHIVIFPDNDKAGRGYAEAVAKLCRDAGAASVKIVELPDLPEKGDIVEFIEAGGTAEQINELVENTPQWEPETEPEATERTESKDRPQGNPVEAARLGDPYKCTDLGNAERLRYWYGDRVKWDIARGCWRLWDGRRWKFDSALKVLELAGFSARKIREEATSCPSDEKQGANMMDILWKHAKSSESEGKLNSACELLKTLGGVAVESGELDVGPMLFNVQNGTINLRTGELSPHRQEDLITRLSPIAYDSEATCERWQKFLSESTGGDKDLEKYLQKVVGYCLTGDTSEECLFFIFGIAASGKTTFLETLKSMLGEYSETINPSMLCKSKFGGGTGAATPELAALAGARLAAGSEVEAGKELDSALVKNVTGGETITARHLYSGMFSFKPAFKIVLAMNDCPKASAEDSGLWRRMRRIEFNHAVPKEKRDKTLKHYLQKEGAAAVLAWAVKGCLLWQLEGLGTPRAVEASTEAYKQESDPLANFFNDCIRINASSWENTTDIASAYNRHCEANGIRYPVSSKRIAERLKKLGAKSERRHRRNGWQGVELKTDSSKDDNDEPESAKDDSETADRVGCVGCDGYSKSFLQEIVSMESLKPSNTSNTSNTEDENDREIDNPFS